jgi:hypothetical protein
MESALLAGPIGPHEGTPTINPIGSQMMLKIPGAATHTAYSIDDNLLPTGSPARVPTVISITTRSSTYWTEP